MKWIARRSQIDFIYLALGFPLFVYCIYSLAIGSIYSSTTNYYTLAENPDMFWLTFGNLSFGSIFIIALAFLESPRWKKRNRILERAYKMRMLRERRSPGARSLLWMVSTYILLPLGIVFALFIIGISLA